MIKCKAKRRARKISKIVNQQCYVVKFKTPIIWYSISTWFDFFKYENVTKDYVDFTDYKGKIYYTTK